MAEELQCPADSKRTDRLAGYESFANILPEFCDAKLLTLGFDMERLDEGDGILAAMVAHQAKWHKTCHLYYYRTQLDRAAKRTADSVDDVDSLPCDYASENAGVKRMMYRRSMSTDSRKSCVYQSRDCFICDTSETSETGP
jgi:hypothetical protein